MPEHTRNTELAWAAGFFDGEGHCAWQGRCLRTQANQCDTQPLERLASILEVGKIYGPIIKIGNRRHQWCWRAYGVAAIVAMEAIYPWLSTIKRAQWDEALMNAAEDGYMPHALRIPTTDPNPMLL